MPRQLTDTEIRILDLVAHGYIDRAIGEELQMSVSTVRTHMQDILRKLQVHTRAHAVAVGVGRGLIQC